MLRRGGYNRKCTKKADLMKSALEEFGKAPDYCFLAFAVAQEVQPFFFSVSFLAQQEEVSFLAQQDFLPTLAQEIMVMEPATTRRVRSFFMINRFWVMSYE